MCGEPPLLPHSLLELFREWDGEAAVPRLLHGSCSAIWGAFAG